MSTNLEPLMSSAKHDWQTPESILKLVAMVDRIKLDPCADPERHFAQTSWTSDGLDRDWFRLAAGGLAYINPPYGRAIPDWIGKCCGEWLAHQTQIVALVPSRTDTQWFHDAWLSVAALCLWKGRIRFVGAEASAPFPSAIFYWGERPHTFRRIFEQHGIVILGKEQD